jgi:hypothetical protein
MYFVLKSLNFIYIIPLYMFRTQMCPSSGVSQLLMHSLVPGGGSFGGASTPATLKLQSQHSRTGGHNEPSTTRDQRLHVQRRSSWWWTQWCPKHVERNNVTKILRIFKKQSTSSWRFIQVITTLYGAMNLKIESKYIRTLPAAFWPHTKWTIRAPNC